MWIDKAVPIFVSYKAQAIAFTIWRTSVAKNTSVYYEPIEFSNRLEFDVTARVGLCNESNRKLQPISILCKRTHGQ